MKRILVSYVLSFAVSVLAGPPISTAQAGQAPGASSDANIPISSRDRVYAAEQFSNTVSVIDPSTNRLLGVIRLGDPAPGNFSPLYKGQLLVHGMGFSPDHHTLAVVAIGSNSVSFIDTLTSTVKHTTYVGRSPHEAFFTPDGSEVWVTVRGENYVEVLDAATFEHKTRIVTVGGPGMTIFSPDGKYGYVCSSFNPELDVITVADHQIVGKVAQMSPFCPNLAATPDGKQVWFTLKDTGKTQVFDAHPPFALLKTLDTGPITNHVNFAVNANGTFAYVTVGGESAVKVFRTDTFAQVATIAVGDMPHGVWPSGDGSRIYVGLENSDTMTAIDTMTNKIVAVIPIGQAPQAIAYVPNAVSSGDSAQNLEPLGRAGQATHLVLKAVGAANGGATLSNVVLYDQGVVQVLQATVTNLQPKHPYVLGLSDSADGSGPITPLANFMTNPAGSAIVDTLGQIRQRIAPDANDMQTSASDKRRYLVIAPSVDGKPTSAVQVQAM